MSRIVLGVSGGIAAYKACDLLRRLQGAGHEVTVVPTAAALEFIGLKHLGRLVRPASAHVSVRRRASGAARQDRAGGRPGLRRPRDRRSARSGRIRTRRRPADKCAADRARPDCLCPSHAQRDVAARCNPGERGDAPEPRSRRRATRHGTADRAGRRPRTAP